VRIAARAPAPQAETSFVEPADVHVRLTLPYHRMPAALHGNARHGHWASRHKDTRMVRSDIVNLAKAAGLHQLPRPIAHITVALIWAPGDRRRRDEDNLFPLLKAVCDALARNRKDLIGLDLVPDDVPQWMTKPTPVIAPPPAKGMWLDLSIRFAEEAS
jgi:crossover junction endodeoxyribonuclease RusA